MIEKKPTPAVMLANLQRQRQQAAGLKRSQFLYGSEKDRAAVLRLAKDLMRKSQAYARYLSLIGKKQKSLRKKAG
jgi:hypothetical protein